MDFKDIEILSCNSFFGSNLIAHFLSGCDAHQIRAEFIYLLFPFVFKKDAREILASSKSTSTLNSAFLTGITGKTALGGLEKRMQYFRSTTQSSLVVASKKFGVSIDEHLKLKTPIDYKKEEEAYLREFFKASHYLGKILSKSDLIDTFIKLGLKEI